MKSTQRMWYICILDWKVIGILDVVLVVNLNTGFESHLHIGCGSGSCGTFAY